MAVEDDDSGRARVADLLWGGDGEHQEQVEPIVGQQLEELVVALALLSDAIENASAGMRDPFPNDLGSVACFTRAFRGLRAATMLCATGYYPEARSILRDVYEAAGLGRMLAKTPDVAEAWLRKLRWIPDREVRAYIERFTIRKGQPSPYAQHYKQVSAWTHPTAVSTLPLVLESDGTVSPKLKTQFDASAVKAVMREVVAVSLFVCFALQRAAAAPESLPAAWRQALAELAADVTGETLQHLDRRWQDEQRLFDELQSNILPAEVLDEYLREHPNSIVNVRRRAADTAGGEKDGRS